MTGIVVTNKSDIAKLVEWYWMFRETSRCSPSRSPTSRRSPSWSTPSRSTRCSSWININFHSKHRHVTNQWIWYFFAWFFTPDALHPLALTPNKFLDIYILILKTLLHIQITKVTPIYFFAFLNSLAYFTKKNTLTCKKNTPIVELIFGKLFK